MIRYASRTSLYLNVRSPSLKGFSLSRVEPRDTDKLSGTFKQHRDYMSLTSFRLTRPGVTLNQIPGHEQMTHFLRTFLFFFLRESDAFRCNSWKFISSRVLTRFNPLTPRQQYFLSPFTALLIAFIHF